MDLRALQKPLKDSYRERPEEARITLTARGSQTGVPVTCSVDVGRALYEAQAHAGTGGPGTGACSGDLLLGALAACAQVTSQMIAASMGIDGRIQVTVEGDLDLRGTLGVARDVGAGFDAIRVRIEVDAPDASDDEVRALHEKTERYCTVLKTLTDPPAIASELVRA
jgi:uncharacterized OsmC-like protein